MNVVLSNFADVNVALSDLANTNVPGEAGRTAVRKSTFNVFNKLAS